MSGCRVSARCFTEVGVGLTPSSSQTGWTLPGALYVLVTLGLILVVAVRAVPVYLNHNEIRNALEETAHDPDLQSADLISVRRAFGRRLGAGYASGVSADDLRLVGNDVHRELVLHYQTGRHLFANISLVFDFNDRAAMHLEDR